MVYLSVWGILNTLGLASWRTEYEFPVDAMGQSPKGKYMDIKTERTDEAVALIHEWRAKGNVHYTNKFATKNVSWLPNVLSKKVEVHFSVIKEFTPTGVILEDGSSLEADKVMYCTGYKDVFPFIKDSSLLPPADDVRALYKHAFHPRAVPNGSLCYIGFSRPTTGAIPACSELVARYFALVVSGKRALPQNAIQLAEEEKTMEDNMFCNSLAVRTVVNPTDYMDGLARLIGCYVSPASWLLNPHRLVVWLTCMSLPCRYRLVGPHANPSKAEKWLNTALCNFTMMETITYVSVKVLNLLGIKTPHTAVF